ncbi:MAG: STM3941 family protein [Pseudomonadota bacterium]
MPKAAEVVEIERSRGGLLGYAARGLFFVAIGVQFAFDPFDLGDPNFYKPAIGWITLVFFGAASLVYVRRAFDRDPVVVTVSSDALWDRRLTKIPLRWLEVAVVGEASYRAQRWVTLSLTDRTTFASAATPFVRLIGPLNRLMGYEPLQMSSNGLKISHGELLRLARDRWERAHGV